MHPREVDAALRARHGHQLLGRLVERDDAPARRHALPRPLARGAARERHAHLRAVRASAGRRRPRRRASGSTRWSTLIVRKYAPLPASSLGYLTSAACATARRNGEPRLAAALSRHTAQLAHASRSTASTGTGRPTRTAIGATRRRAGALARAVRSRGVGSPPLRAALGLALSLRGVHAGAEAQARLLRAAAAVARRRHRLGQRHGARVRSTSTSATYVGKAPREAAYRRELEAELERMASVSGSLTSREGPERRARQARPGPLTTRRGTKLRAVASPAPRAAPPHGCHPRR